MEIIFDNKLDYYYYIIVGETVGLAVGDSFCGTVGFKGLY